MRFLCSDARYNDKVETKDFIIIVIYIAKFSSMTLTVKHSSTFIRYLMEIIQRAPLLFFFLPSLFIGVLCLKTYELSFISANDGGFSPQVWMTIEQRMMKCSHFLLVGIFPITLFPRIHRHHRKCSTWASKKRKFFTLYYVRYQDLLYVSVYFYILSNMLNIIHRIGIRRCSGE